MRNRLIHTVLATACAAASLPALPAVDLGDVTLEESIQVGGRHLKLNGAGISKRLVFKIYAMGLYLPDRKQHAAEVLAADGPRRMTIVPLRAISGDDFAEAVMSDLSTGRFGSPEVLAHLVRLAEAIAQQPGGLRKGDVLTLDWLPEVGAVVAINRRPLAAPVRDIAVYNALLAVWLGDKPADPSLKPKLLGMVPVAEGPARL
ncbi:chalcone isomerase family protein [Pseudorhodoferax sp.]|uniref:chalcone isomerase family protein n=1 Tax=Pseudorhodoferax sp. TaxID=1993553 RepID=UPI002DD67F9D|nr:chalcone isomerase family protein [Pseudorhodoferax sp.]